MPQTQNNAAGFFFLVFLFYLLIPDGEFQTQSLILSDLAAERLGRYGHALEVVNTSHWGDFAPRPAAADGEAEGARYLNLTGFREEDHYAWDDLDVFREKGLRLSRHAFPTVDGEQPWDLAEGPPIWSNALGTLHGDWKRRPASVARTYDAYNLSDSVPSMDWMGANHEWSRNVTGDSGRMLFRLEGNKTTLDYDQLGVEGAPLSGGQIRDVRGIITIEDVEGSGHSWEVRVWGAHWPKQGLIMLTTTSEKFEGIFGLPHLTPSADFYQSSQKLLNKSLAETIQTKQDDVYVDQNMPWNSDAENPLHTTNPSPHCELVAYMQVHPPTRQDLGLDSSQAEDRTTLADAIAAVETELDDPLGAPIPRIPRLEMSAVLYSPDCAFFLETKGPPDFPPIEGQHLVGLKSEVHLYQAKTWLLIFAAVVFGQVYLLQSQIQECFTPSTMGRVSFTTLSIMVMIDGMTFTGAATWVSTAAGTFLPTLTLMFASFLSTTIGGSFLAKLYEVQLPEMRSRRTRDRGGNTASSNTSSSVSTAPTPEPPLDSGRGQILPAPVTAGRPQRLDPDPVIIPSDQDIDAEIAETAPSAVPGLTTRPAQPPQQQVPTEVPFQTIVGRGILLSLVLIFIGLSTFTWYPYLRSLFFNTCAFAYMSLWIPQIYRNTQRNCRRALTWPFVVGQSILRLLPITYFWIKTDNFLYARTEPHAFLALCAWVWLQIVVLAGQDVLGPRFGLPKGWAPEAAWDYHPVLREDNVEAGGLPIGLISSEDRAPGHTRTLSNSSDKVRRRGSTSIRSIDCSICREALEVAVVRAGEADSASGGAGSGGVAGMLARRLYMVTPCRHIFHTACLEGWMRFRLQCPICREELPPL